MLLAEELLLIALDPQTGRVPISSQEYLRVVVSAALLAELALSGRVQIQGDRVVVVPGEAPADPLLAATLAAVGSDLAGRKAKVVVQKLSKALGGSREQVVDRLVAAGVIGQEKKGRLSSTRHPVLDRTTQDKVLADVRSAAKGQGPLDARQAVLLAFAGPCRLLEKVAPDRSQHRQAKARIKEATRAAPFGPEVKKIIDDLVAAAAVVAVVAGAGS